MVHDEAEAGKCGGRGTDVARRRGRDRSIGHRTTQAFVRAHDPRAAANAIAACFEGLILHRVARHDDTDPRPTFELVMRAALS